MSLKTRAVDDALAACNHATTMRCSVSQSLKNNTPGEVVFACDTAQHSCDCRSFEYTVKTAIDGQ